MAGEKVIIAVCAASLLLFYSLSQHQRTGAGDEPVGVSLKADPTSTWRGYTSLPSTGGPINYATATWTVPGVPSTTCILSPFFGIGSSDSKARMRAVTRWDGSSWVASLESSSDKFQNISTPTLISISSGMTVKATFTLDSVNKLYTVEFKEMGSGSVFQTTFSTLTNSVAKNFTKVYSVLETVPGSCACAELPPGNNVTFYNVSLINNAGPMATTGTQCGCQNCGCSSNANFTSDSFIVLWNRGVFEPPQKQPQHDVGVSLKADPTSTWRGYTSLTSTGGPITDATATWIVPGVPSTTCILSPFFGIGSSDSKARMRAVTRWDGSSWVASLESSSDKFQNISTPTLISISSGMTVKATFTFDSVNKLYTVEFKELGSGSVFQTTFSTLTNSVAKNFTKVYSVLETVPGSCACAELPPGNNVTFYNVSLINNAGPMATTGTQCGCQNCGCSSNANYTSDSFIVLWNRGVFEQPQQEQQQQLQLPQQQDQQQHEQLWLQQKQLQAANTHEGEVHHKKSRA